MFDFMDAQTSQLQSRSNFSYEMGQAQRIWILSERVELIVLPHITEAKERLGKSNPPYRHSSTLSTSETFFADNVAGTQRVRIVTGSWGTSSNVGAV